MPQRTARARADDSKSRHTAAVLLMNDHYLRYLLQLYAAFDGDIVAAVVLGEVAHHNVSALRQGLTPQQMAARLAEPGFRDELVPTNAFSIAQATGIPRETVRRKVAFLVSRGLLRQDAKANLVVTPESRDRFEVFNLTLLRDHLDTAARLHELLDTPSP